MSSYYVQCKWFTPRSYKLYAHENAWNTSYICLQHKEKQSGLWRQSFIPFSRRRREESKIRTIYYLFFLLIQNMYQLSSFSIMTKFDNILDSKTMKYPLP